MNDIKIADMRSVEESSFTTQQLKDDDVWTPVVVVHVDVIRKAHCCNHCGARMIL